MKPPNRKLHRRDTNQEAIVYVFEKMGAAVFQLDQVGNGLPDLLVGVNGFNLLVEVKSAKGKLTAAQHIFFDEWHGQKIIIRTIDEAITLIQKYRSF